MADDLFEADAIRALAAEATALWRSGGFRPAGIGRGDNWERRPEIRDDYVHWPDSEPSATALVRYLDVTECLRLAINRSCFLGLFTLEHHFAAYPPGARYRRHVDQFRGITDRAVTVIVYLNKRWLAEDGGQLRLYTDAPMPGNYVDIAPLAGRVVLFESPRFYHEVLPATRLRLSLTGWYRRR